MKSNAQPPVEAYEQLGDTGLFDSGRSAVRRLASLQGISTLFAASISIFLVAHMLPHHVFFEIVKLIAGFTAVILVPGWLFTDLSLPESVHGLGVTIVSGLLLPVIEIQILFLISLIFQVQIPLLYWIVLCQVILVSSCLIFYQRNKKSGVSENAVSLGNPKLLPIIVIAIIPRVALAFLSTESIGVDATLFADYARAIVNGSFQSAVMNDAAVIPISNGMEYLIHQGYVYLAAVSFLLVTPVLSGPVAILIIVGIVLLLLAYQITAHYFGTQAGLWVTGILAVHPLFVFHSSVGYGPEIVSVVIILYGGILLIKTKERSPLLLLFIGILLGLTDVTWYANIYVLSVVLPIAFVALRYFSRGESLRFSLLLPLVLVGLVNLRDLLLYLIVWSTVFALLIASRHFWNTLKLHSYLPLYLGFFITLVAWRLPVQISYIQRQIPPTPVTNIVPALLQPITPELIGTFTIFFLFHLTPTIAILVLWSLIKGTAKPFSVSLMFIGFLSAAGTLKTLGMRSEGPLELVFLYSDSRFFIFLTLVFTISLGSLFMVLQKNGDASIKLSLPRVGAFHFGRRNSMIAVFILIGFVPGYLVMPSGLALTDFETRYGWRELDMIVNSLGDEDSVYLLNRAREFSWLTGREAVVLSYSRSSLDPLNASLETLAMRAAFNTSFLVWDLYNVQKWQTFEFLLSDPMDVGSHVLLDISRAIDSVDLSTTGIAFGLKLAAETPINEIGRFSRVYSFENSTFVKAQNISLLSDGWEVTNQGTLTESTDGIHLAIAQGENSTTLRRDTSFDLGFSVDSGYILFSIEDPGSILTRLEIWSSSGELLREAEQVSTNVYYCPLGTVNVGEIRLTIEGEPGSEVLINSICIWESS